MSSGPTACTSGTRSWTVGGGSLYESCVTQAAWESLDLFRYKATVIWRRGMAHPFIKRMDDLDRDTKNTMIQLVWSALPDPAVMTVLMQCAPGERPVSVPEVVVGPKVDAEARKAQRLMADLQFGGLQRHPDSGKVEPTLR
jgi:hypothetical protein